MGIHSRLIGLRVWPSRWNAVTVWPRMPEDRKMQEARDRIPKDRSSFAFFFEPLLPNLEPLWWHYEGDALLRGASVNPEVEAFYDSLPANEAIAPGTLFPRYVNLIIEDWLSLYGMRNQACTRAQIIANSDNEEFMFRHMEIVFNNIDGACWELFSANEVWIDRVQSHVKGLGAPFETRPAIWKER